jgi:hypothetical protein
MFSTSLILGFPIPLAPIEAGAGETAKPYFLVTQATIAYHSFQTNGWKESKVGNFPKMDFPLESTG